MDSLHKDATHFYMADKTQVFTDNVTLASANGCVTKRWYHPEYRQDKPVLCKDRPWEHLPYFTYSNYTVIRDPDDGLFKCWYQDWEPGLDRKYKARQLYAQSADGANWEKPELGIAHEQGRNTNICLGEPDTSFHSMNVVLDPHPSSSRERFKALYSRVSSAGECRIECAHSADGIHWHIYEQLPSFGISGPRLEDVSVIFYDEDSRQFVQNTRHFLKGRAARIEDNINYFAGRRNRRIWQCRSSDFLRWSEPVLVADIDDDDNLDDHFYGMAQFKVGNIHLATLGLLHMVDNTRHVELLSSRDGIRWSRPARNAPFLAPRGPGHWDAYMTAIVSPPIQMQDELWFYVGGSACHHDWWSWGANEGMDHPEAKDFSKAQFSLGLATLRRDGFVSLYSNKYREGIIKTQPLISAGAELIINARCAPGGHIKVAVTDPEHKVIEPCSLENCDPFIADSLDHKVTWKGKSHIAGQAETGLYWRRLHFVLNDAELFSLRFAGAEQSDFSFARDKGRAELRE